MPSSSIINSVESIVAVPPSGVGRGSRKRPLLEALLVDDEAAPLPEEDLAAIHPPPEKHEEVTQRAKAIVPAAQVYALGHR